MMFLIILALEVKPAYHEIFRVIEHEKKNHIIKHVK